MIPVPKAYLFDVDGVLSDPVAKQVTNPELFAQIIIRLHRGEPVGLNTGRSTKWMIDRIIAPLRKKIDAKDLLSKFIAIGEKGATWVTFDEEGTMHFGEIKELSMDPNLLVKTKELVAKEYSDAMFFDDTKETMLSIEMRDGFDLTRFHTRQKTLDVQLQQLLEENGLAELYKIDSTTIATDVESPYVGKALGAERFLQFLSDKNISPAEFKTFGDSVSDFAMADELDRRGEKVTFIYVGNRDKLREVHKSYLIEYVGGFSDGTLTYLQQETT